MAAGPDPDTTLRLSRDYDAPPDLVFDTFFDAKALRYIFSADAYTIVDMQVDARVGGGWNLAMRDTASGTIARSTARYIEIERPKRIVCLTKWLDGPLAGRRDMRVTLEFEKIGRGTRLKLTHEFFPDRKTCEQHGSGWSAALERLAARLAEASVR